MKGFHLKEPLYMLFYNIMEMSGFCKSVKLGRFINKHFVNLCAVFHTIQSMVVHKNDSNCRKMSKKKMIRRFYDIIK